MSSWINDAWWKKEASRNYFTETRWKENHYFMQGKEPKRWYSYQPRLGSGDSAIWDVLIDLDNQEIANVVAGRDTRDNTLKVAFMLHDNVIRHGNTCNAQVRTLMKGVQKYKNTLKKLNYCKQLHDYDILFS